MDIDYKDWPVVREILVRNRLEHTALLAHGINLSEHRFVRMAFVAFRTAENKIEAAKDVQARFEEALRDAARERAAGEEAEPPAEPVKVKEPKLDPGIEANLPKTNEPEADK